MVEVTACELCRVTTTPSAAQTAWNGDSLYLFEGTGPTFQLRGLYRGDSIAGDVISTASEAGVVETYRGRFVAKRVP
jgi:hypothetical protein